MGTIILLTIIIAGLVFAPSIVVAAGHALIWYAGVNFWGMVALVSLALALLVLILVFMIWSWLG